MLFAFEKRIDLFERLAFRLDPIYSLDKSQQEKLSVRYGAYDQDHHDDIPTPVDHVHLPADVGKTDGHHEDKQSSGNG